MEAKARQEPSKKNNEESRADDPKRRRKDEGEKMDVDSEAKGEVIDLDVGDIFAEPPYDSMWYYMEPEEMSVIGNNFDRRYSVDGTWLSGLAPSSKTRLDEVIQQAAGDVDGAPYVERSQIMEDEDVIDHPFYAKVTKMGSLRITPNTGASFSRKAVSQGVTYGSVARRNIPHGV